ncbi:interactor of ZYG-11 domain-containing protein [Ditylenchus destructor]|uniref:Interactor of ZYG-11 domain-containing protein n=1 Tax=Ditylenchus destructor TaxID=166010 RepID=A0AAD4N540_9BILA|nr:interactor of ZYG-11 domain-containing protein [Ditylenchus destructor]
MSEASSVMQPVKQLVEKYRSEFESVYDNVRQQSLEISNDVQQYAQKMTEKIHAAEPQLKPARKRNRSSSPEHGWFNITLEPVEYVQNLKLLEHYSWISVMQMAVFVSSTVSAYVLYPIVGLVLNGFSAFLLCFALLPYLAYLHLSKLPFNATLDAQAMDKQARYQLLAFALVEGLLSGFVFASRRLESMEPLAFLSSLGIALAAQVLSGLPSGNQRAVLLGGCVGAGFTMQLTLGFVLGQLSAPYVFLSLLYAGLAYSALQLQIQQKQSSVNPHIAMLSYVVAALFAEAIVVGLFGGSNVSSVVPLMVKEQA